MNIEETEKEVYVHKLGCSRVIPIGDYFSLLQSEYISYAFRRKTYKREEDIKKFREICEKKKEKIDSFSAKNCLPSIFNGDKVYLQKYLDKFLNEWGMPNFMYRDEYKKIVYSFWDVKYWLQKGTEVKFKTNDSIEFGVVVKIQDDTLIVRDSNGTQYHVEVKNTARILTDDFLDLNK